MTTFFLLLALLAVAAGVLARRRLRAERRNARLTDDMVRRIEREGRLEREEEVDLEEVRGLEDEFWDQSWDEPEPL